jgi:hypothetical protein
MKINHTAHISSNKHFCTISPKDRFEQNLVLNLSFYNKNNIDNFTHGFIDFHYQMFDGFKEIKRRLLTKEDFLQLSLEHYINTGELISKIRIGVYFQSNLNHELNIKLEETMDPPIDNSIGFSLLKQSIMFGPSIEFLERLRSMRHTTFESIISDRLSELENCMNEYSGKTFNKWALADTILKLSAQSKISLHFLDFAVENYFEEYDNGKKRLGLNYQNNKNEI